MNESIHRDVTVVTPEHVQLEYRTAGLGSRSAAHLVDAGLLLLAYGVVVLVVGVFMAVLQADLQQWFGDFAAAFLIIFAFVLSGGYFALMEYFYAGQTLGKRLMGLKVIQDNGQSVTFLSSVIRNFFRLIDFLPSFYFFGSIWMFVNKKDKRLGDVAAGTMVVRDTRLEQQKLRRRTQKWLANWKEHRPRLELSDAVRKRIDREDWQLISLFVERLPAMEKLQCEHYAWQIALTLAPKLEMERSDYELWPVGFVVALYEQLVDEWTIQ